MTVGAGLILSHPADDSVSRRQKLKRLHWRGFQLGSGGSQQCRHTTLKWLNPASAPTGQGTSQEARTR
jgi:hypothetical protein